MSEQSQNSFSKNSSQRRRIVDQKFLPSLKNKLLEVTQKIKSIQSTILKPRLSIGSGKQEYECPLQLKNTTLSMNYAQSQSKASLSLQHQTEKMKKILMKSRMIAYQMSSGLPPSKKNPSVVYSEISSGSENFQKSKVSVSTTVRSNCFSQTCQQLMQIKKMRNKRRKQQEEIKKSQDINQRNKGITQNTKTNLINNKDYLLIANVKDHQNLNIETINNNKELLNNDNICYSNKSVNVHFSNVLTNILSQNQFQQTSQQKQIDYPKIILSTPFKCKMQKKQLKTQNTVHSISTNTDSKQLKIQDFCLLRFIEKGQLGQVYLATHIQTNFLCAIKIIDKAMLPTQCYEQLAREVKIHSFLQHPNIVRLFTAFSDSRYLYLILEYCTDGNLYSTLRKQKQISEKKVKEYIKQICKGIQYMHKNDIIHRDIKPENVLLEGDFIKLCDFGWSVYSPLMRKTRCGSPLYSSPELIKEIQYDNKIDIWNVGMLTYELLYGRVPFKIRCEEELIKIVQEEVYFSSTHNISKEGINFIQQCLKKQPRQRIDIFKLNDHQFLN